MNVPGEHNIMNSLGAVTLGFELGLSFNSIKSGLTNYSGVRRRFDIKGVHKDIMIVDDYAHHPTEVRETINAIKNGWSHNLIVIFQPHLYSRTKEFYKAFANALDDADYIILTDIYPAREEPIPGVSSKLIFDQIKTKDTGKLFYLKDLDKLHNIIDPLIEPDSIVLTLGAGNIWRYGEKYFKHLKKYF